jgi:hypothetical protein
MHTSKTKQTVLTLLEDGLSINEVSARLRGLIDRDTVKRWAKNAQESPERGN